MTGPETTSSETIASETTATGPLSGTVVIDLSRALAGPHATMMMADLGARVIKVESATGDDSRHWGPPFVGPEDEPMSTYFLSANRNKESIQLDLKSTEGLAMLKALVERADVLVENFRTGVLDRLGLPLTELQALNPRLVVLSITGFGHDGPEGDRPGYDQIVQGEAGFMSLTGPGPGQPTKAGISLADLLAGMYGAYGVVAALSDRHRTGRGTVVRTSLLAAVVGVHAFQGTRHTVAGEIPEPTGNHHASIAPYGAFQAGDGVMQVAVGNDTQWRAFAGVLGLQPDDPRFSSNAARLAHREELFEEMERILATQTAAKWLTRLRAAGVPCGKVRSLDEVYAWEQTRSQGLVIEVEHPTVGRVELPGPPLRLEGLDGEPLGRTQHAPPPRLGEHSASVMAWLADVRTTC